MPNREHRSVFIGNVETDDEGRCADFAQGARNRVEFLEYTRVPSLRGKEASVGGSLYQQRVPALYLLGRETDIQTGCNQLSRKNDVHKMGFEHSKQLI